MLGSKQSMPCIYIGKMGLRIKPRCFDLDLITLAVIRIKERHLLVNMFSQIGFHIRSDLLELHLSSSILISTKVIKAKPKHLGLILRPDITQNTFPYISEGKLALNQYNFNTARLAHHIGCGGPVHPPHAHHEPKITGLQSSGNLVCKFCQVLIYQKPKVHLFKNSSFMILAQL